MYWPANSTSKKFGPNAAEYSVYNIVCTFLRGSNAEYAAGQTRFCNFIQQISTFALRVGKEIIHGGVCNAPNGDNVNCDMFFDIVFQAARGFVQREIEDVCELAYAALYQDYSNGGYGQIDAGNQIEGSFSGGWEESTSETCVGPNTDEAMCTVTYF